jgi:hypothetical protein
MVRKTKIDFAFTDKFLFLMFVILMSIPVGYYAYSFREFSLNYRTELVISPYTKKRKVLKYYNFIKKRKSFDFKLNINILKFYLSYFQNYLNTLFVLLKQKLYSVSPACFIPINQYYPKSDIDVYFS